MSYWKPLGKEKKKCKSCNEIKFMNKNDDICLKCKRQKGVKNEKRV